MRDWIFTHIYSWGLREGHGITNCHNSPILRQTKFLNLHFHEYSPVDEKVEEKLWWLFILIDFFSPYYWFRIILQLNDGTNSFNVVDFKKFGSEKNELKLWLKLYFFQRKFDLFEFVYAIPVITKKDLNLNYHQKLCFCSCYTSMLKNWDIKDRKLKFNAIRLAG